MRRLARLAALALCALALGGEAPPAGPDLARILEEAPAKTLKAYGFFLGPGAGSPAPGVEPYRLNTPLFSDYAEKSRLMYLPPGKAARYAGPGLLDLPVGTTLLKTFAFPADLRRPDAPRRLIETRLLIRKASGWTAVAYLWRPDGADADLKRAGASADVAFVDGSGRPRRIAYHVPNVNECKTCHQTGGEVTPIGPKARNLNGAAADGSNQLDAWRARGRLTGAPPAAEIARLADWSDAHASLDERARAYLEVNCAHCHSPDGFASNSGLYLSVDVKTPAALGVGKRPVAAGRGSGGLLVSISPGEPDRSILLYRMTSEEPGVMMPQLGRSLAHAEGVDLIRAWIASLKPAVPSGKTSGS